MCSRLYLFSWLELQLLKEICYCHATGVLTNSHFVAPYCCDVQTCLLLQTVWLLTQPVDDLQTRIRHYFIA